MNKIENWKIFVMLLKEIATSKGITEKEVCKKTGLNPTEVSQVFSLTVCPSH